MKAKKRRNKEQRRNEFANQIIQKKNLEIDSLKNKIMDLQISCEEKDSLINSIDGFRKELAETIDELKAKKQGYDVLMDDLIQMRKVFNQTVFKGRWKIIKWLMK